MIKVIGLFAILLFSPHVSTVKEDWLSYERQGMTGRLHDFYASEEFTVILHDKNMEELRRIRSFLIKSGQAYRALLPLETTLNAGTYTLRFLNKEGSLFSEGALELQEFQAHTETIPIGSEKTSAILQKPDPKKERESALLWTLLSTHHPQGIWHDERPFIFPLKDSFRLTAPFASRRIYAFADGRLSQPSIHWGSDWGAPRGTKVYAPAAGRVVFAAERIVTGKTLIIEHFPSIYTLFYHLDSLEVESGHLVEQDQLVATVGSTGFSTGPHLHWELRAWTIPLDPESLVGNTGTNVR